MSAKIGRFQFFFIFARKLQMELIDVPGVVSHLVFANGIRAKENGLGSLPLSMPLLCQFRKEFLPMWQRIVRGEGFPASVELSQVFTQSVMQGLVAQSGIGAGVLRLIECEE